MICFSMVMLLAIGSVKIWKARKKLKDEQQIYE